jgi:hypothetical protein
MASFFEQEDFNMADGSKPTSAAASTNLAAASTNLADASTHLADASTSLAVASTPPGKVRLASKYARDRLDDALSLASYAVGSGFRTTTGDPLSLADIGMIQDTAAKLGEFDPPPVQSQPGASQDTAAPPSVTAAEWIAFELAYYRLAVAMSPVTAETLEATEATTLSIDSSPLYRFRDWIFGNSPALRFTRMFAVVAIGLGAFVVLAEGKIYVLGLEGDALTEVRLKNTLESLLPWAYGGLGSCAYLLRSAHYYIYQRSFDLRRKPEYFNRVLLGAISGGAIILFVNYLVDDGSGSVLHLSSAALGFVAGYSTDFLFNTIERVIAAIFPKTDNDPKVQLARSATKTPLIGSDNLTARGDGSDDSNDAGKAGQRQVARTKDKSLMSPKPKRKVGDGT